MWKAIIFLCSFLLSETARRLLKGRRCDLRGAQDVSDALLIIGISFLPPISEHYVSGTCVGYGALHIFPLLNILSDCDARNMHACTLLQIRVSCSFYDGWQGCSLIEHLSLSKRC